MEINIIERFKNNKKEFAIIIGFEIAIITVSIFNFYKG